MLFPGTAVAALVIMTSLCVSSSGRSAPEDTAPPSWMGWLRPLPRHALLTLIKESGTNNHVMVIVDISQRSTAEVLKVQTDCMKNRYWHFFQSVFLHSLSTNCSLSVFLTVLLCFSFQLSRQLITIAEETRSNPWSPNIPHPLPILSSLYHWPPLSTSSSSVKPLVYLSLPPLNRRHHTHVHADVLQICKITIPISLSPASASLSLAFLLHLPHSLMQFNSNGFYWLGDSSECSSSVQLHKRALWAFTRQSSTFSSQSQAHASACTFTHSHT